MFKFTAGNPPFNASNVVNVVFWRECLKRSKPTLLIDELKLLEFLQENGFGRYSDNGYTFIGRKLNNRTYHSYPLQVRDFVYDYVCNLPDEISESFFKDDLKLLLIKSRSLFSQSRLNWLARLDDTSQEGVRHE